MDSSIFAAQFSDLFNKFVKQQMDFQKNIEKTLQDISKTIDGSKKSETVKRDFLSKEDQKYREGRPDPDEVQKPKEPRKVVQDILSVKVEDISDKAAKKLDDDDNVSNITTNNMSGGGFDWMKLLGPLLGIGIGGLGFALNEIGMDTTLLSRVFQGTNLSGKILEKLKMGKYLNKIQAAFGKSKIVSKLFKLLGPAKVVLRRLPLIGLLFTFGEAVSKFKTGEPGQILSGLLDIGAGISYMFPGAGTAVGIGIDLLNYWYENKLEELGPDNQPQNWGELFTKIKDFIYESSFIQYFVKIGEGVKKLYNEPNMINLIEVLEHIIGNNPVLVFLKSLDEGIGSMLGLEDEEGNAQSLTGWIGNWVNEKIIEPISDFFEWVGGLLLGAFNKLKDYATKKIEEVKKKIEELNPVKNVSETYEALTDNTNEEVAENQSNLIEKSILEKLKERGVSEEELQRKQRMFGLGWAEDETDYNRRLIDLERSTRPEMTVDNEEAQDFIISDGNFNSVVRDENVQKFSEDDTIIGFKEGEALTKGIEQLIEVGQQQLQMLNQYLEKASAGAGGNVVAPSTTNNYTYNVESSVSAFRKALS